MENIREAFSGSNVMYLASWQDGFAFVAAYMVGLAPFLRFKGVDVLTIPFMTRDWTKFKLNQRSKFSLLSADYWMLTAYVGVLPILTRLS